MQRSRSEQTIFAKSAQSSRQRRAKGAKVFWFFFSKKNIFSCRPDVPE
jgi:hypothetical protein